MRQKSIGEVLKAARESQGLSLDQLQRMTKIQAKYLQALEYDDFEFIPDRAYTRSFLERYAETLDLDAAVLLDAYDHHQLLVYYDAGEEADMDFERSRRKKTKQKKGSILPLVYLLLAASFILIFVTYVVYSRIQNQARLPETPSSYQVVSETKSSSLESSLTEESSSTETDEATSTSTSSTKQNGQLTVTGSDSQLSANLTGASGLVEVTLTVTDATSWISLTETDLAGGVVLSPENKTVTTTIPEGITSTVLTLGVVKGVDITVNGQKLDTSGLTAETATIVLTIE